MKPYNISRGQHIFLVALFKNNGINQEELSNNIKIDKGTTARAIKKLEEEGYVVREIDPADKRAYKLYVTEKALEIKPKFIEVLSSWTDILSDGFTEEEKEITLKLLKKMAQNATKITKINDIDRNRSDHS
ncbi:MarR family transcriptional regulator [Lutibacter sp. B2]|nr:MarR family transcriptional regulator [Lutibacter sp. B2]